MITPSGPSYAGFILSRKCSARCLVCYLRNEAAIVNGARRADALPLFGSHSIPDEDMDPVLVQEVLTAYPTVVGVDLSALGEAFDHPGFDRAFEIAASFAPHVASIGVTSNGRRLDEHLQVLSAPGGLTISVDSPDPDHCNVLRPGTDGHRVWRNLALAASAPRHSGRVLQVNMILTRRNIDEIPAMASKCASLGIPNLCLLRAIHLGGPNADDQLTYDHPGVRETILTARQRHAGLAIADHFTYFDGGLPTDGKSHCEWPFLWMLIDGTGQMRLCCRIQHPPVGHVLRDDPWHAPIVDRLRHCVLGNGDRSEFPACTTCHARHGAGTSHLT